MAHKAVTDIAKWRAQAFEEMGGDGFPFTLTVLDDNGAPVIDPATQQPKTETFNVPHPLALNGKRSELFEAAAGNIASAKALLNDPDPEGDTEVYDRFIAYGGQPGDVMIAYRIMAKEMNAPKS